MVHTKAEKRREKEREGKGQGKVGVLEVDVDGDNGGCEDVEFTEDKDEVGQDSSEGD